MRSFTREELAQCNSKDGAPAHIAYEGRGYDASGSFLWRGGRHLAGLDYTGGLVPVPTEPICWRGCLSLGYWSTQMESL